MSVAAIDQGTTSTRVLRHTAKEPIGVVHSVRHGQKFPQPGWVEHDPIELLKNVSDCIEAAGKVDAIGIDNQGESCLAWDAVTGEPLSPVIVWQDNRTQPSLEKLRHEGAEELTLSRAGLPLDAYFSASKFGWILNNIPEARAALSAGRLRLGTTDAFFLDRLVGRFVTDPTTASRTCLMNLESGDWDNDLCRLFGVPREALPPIGVTAGEVIGHIAGVPVTASVVDQQAALYGHGCRRPGDAKITFGTGAFALALTGPHVVHGSKSGLLPTVAWKTPGETIYAIDGGIYDAGSVMEWLSRLGLLTDLSELQSFDSAPAIAGGLAFVPALSGLACPHWDRTAAGLWLGMSADTSRSQMLQSAVEGVALATAQVIAAMQQDIPLAPTLSIDGGLSRSPYFAQFLADVLEREIVTHSFDELTGLGCAALAGLAIGEHVEAAENKDTVYRSRSVDAGPWRHTFSQAVARSRDWRKMG